jgi:hypothetical protein
MIDAFCPDHGHAVLLGHHAIDEVRNTESGIEVHLNCHCGAHLVVATGRRQPRRRPVSTI